jgi:hypothetical protein
VVHPTGHELHRIAGTPREVRGIRDKFREMLSHETGELTRLGWDVC